MRKGTEQKESYRVLNQGTERTYESLEDLLQGLEGLYRGSSVTIYAQNGTDKDVKTFFVDIGRDGRILETFSEPPNKVVDVERLRMDAVA